MSYTLEKFEGDELPMFDFVNSESGSASMHTELEKAVKFYRKNGLVLIKVLTKEECERGILDQWESFISTQPWKNDPLSKFKNMRKSELLKFLSEKIETTEDLETLRNHWTMHRTFGASSDPECFHLQSVWNVRQKKCIVDFAKSVIHGSKLAEDSSLGIWVDINRCIQKLPKEGDNAFLHWDIDVLKRYVQDASSNQEAMQRVNQKTDWPEADDERNANHGKIYSALQGKVMYTSSQFVATPRTHTQRFFCNFLQNTKKTDYPIPMTDPSKRKQIDKFALDKKKLQRDGGDPLGVLACEKKFKVPAGCMIAWSDRLLHGHASTPRDNPIEFGMYLGYFADRSSNNTYKEKSKDVLKRMANTKLVAAKKGQEETLLKAAQDQPTAALAPGAVTGYKVFSKDVNKYLLHDNNFKKLCKDVESLDKQRLPNQDTLIQKLTQLTNNNKVFRGQNPKIDDLKGNILRFVFASLLRTREEKKMLCKEKFEKYIDKTSKTTTRDQRQGLQGLEEISEIQDRIRSFRYGVAPLMWPSYDPIHYFPNAWESNGYTNAISRMLKMDTSRYKVHYNLKTTDRYFPNPIEQRVSPIPYKVPQLTDLGCEILGITKEEYDKIREEMNQDMEDRDNVDEDQRASEEDAEMDDNSGSKENPIILTSLCKACKGVVI